MGFTSWIDKRIAVAVDRAVADANATAARDVAEILAAFAALPEKVGAEVEAAFSHLLPGFMRTAPPDVVAGMEKRDTS